MILPFTLERKRTKNKKIITFMKYIYDTCSLFFFLTPTQLLQAHNFYIVHKDVSYIILYCIYYIFERYGIGSLCFQKNTLFWELLSATWKSRLCQLFAETDNEQTSHYWCYQFQIWVMRYKVYNTITDSTACETMHYYYELHCETHILHCWNSACQNYSGGQISLLLCLNCKPLYG